MLSVRGTWVAFHIRLITQLLTMLHKTVTLWNVCKDGHFILSSDDNHSWMSIQIKKKFTFYTYILGTLSQQFKEDRSVGSYYSWRYNKTHVSAVVINDDVGRGFCASTFHDTRLKFVLFTHWRRVTLLNWL